MKNTLLATLFGAFCAASAFSQPIFAPVGTQWTYTEYAFFPPIPNSPWDWKSRPWRLECVAETVFQGKPCRKLVGGRLGFPPETEFYVYSQRDSVFLWNGQAFTLLYDFSAKPGDTWVFDHPNYTFDRPTSITVDSVGLTQVGPVALKTWYIHYDEYSDWGNVIYEGIGNSCYFLPKSDLIDRPFCDLRCFLNPTQALDLNFGTVPCDYVDVISKTSAISINAPAVTVSPNPSQDEAILTVSGLQGAVSISFYDGQGRVLRQEEHFLNDPNKTAIPIALDGLPTGMLCLRCEQGGFAQILRLVHVY